MKEAQCQSFESLYLMGGSCCDPSLVQLLEKELRMPLECFNPFAAPSVTMVNPIEQQCIPLYVQAFGLAVRSINDLVQN